MADRWQFIPDAVLDTERQQQKAQDWAQSQYAGIAQQWGDMWRKGADSLLHVYNQHPSYPRQPEPPPSLTDSPSPNAMMLKPLSDYESGQVMPDKVTAPDTVTDTAPSDEPSFLQRLRELPTPDIPHMPFSGAPLPPPQFGKPVLPDAETERKMNEGTLTAGDVVGGLVRTASKQMESLPTSFDQMPGIKLGTSEEDVGRAAAMGYGEGRGAGAGAGGVDSLVHAAGAGGQGPTSSVASMSIDDIEKQLAQHRAVLESQLADAEKSVGRAEAMMKNPEPFRPSDIDVSAARTRVEHLRQQIDDFDAAYRDAKGLPTERPAVGAGEGLPPSEPPTAIGPEGAGGGEPPGPPADTLTRSPAQGVTFGNAERWLRDVRMGSMLSSPQSWPRIGLATGLEVPWKLAQDFGTAVVRGHPAEVAPELSAMVQGAREFLPTFWNAVKTGGQSGLTELHTMDYGRSPLGMLGNLSQYPVRAHIGITEGFQNLMSKMEMARLAGLDATNAGLKGAEWSQRVDSLLQNPTPLMDQLSRGVALRGTYRSDVGQVGSWLQNIQKTPYLGQILAPMVRVPYNIAARGMDLTPVGMAGTAIDVARGVYGNLRDPVNRAAQIAGTSTATLPQGVIPLRERASANILGGVLMATGALAASQGVLTGPGPDDPKKLGEMRARGWQPWSVLVGDTWVPMRALGRFALPLELAAETWESGAYGYTPDKAASSILQHWVQDTPVRDIAELGSALSSGDWGKYIRGLAGTFVPFGAAVNNVGQAFDPYRRVAKGPIEAVQARTPGLRNDLPVMQDVLGRPVEEPHTGLNALNPFAQNTAKQDPTITMLENNNVTIGYPPRNLQGAPLTPDEQRTLQRIAGQHIIERVQQIAPVVDALPPEQRRQFLQRAVNDAHRQAAVDMVHQIGPGAFAQRQQAAKSAALVPLRRAS